MKKVLSGAIVLLLLFLALPTNVYASGGPEPHNVTAEQVGNDVHLFSDDDQFLSLLVENGKAVFQLSQGGNYCKVYHEFSGDELEKTADYVIVKNVTDFIPNGRQCTLWLYINDTWTEDGPYCTIQNSNVTLRPKPNDLNISCNNNHIYITSEDTEYINDIWHIRLAQSNNGEPHLFHAYW